MSRYDTNLASEFYVLSMLHRMGANPTLTLGNKKAVDIFIFNNDGTSKTVDVKGVAKRYDWPADNIEINCKGHYLVFVCFEGNIDDYQQLPSVWVIPSEKVEQFLKKYNTRTVISRAKINKNGHNFKDAWNLLLSK